MGVLDTLVNNFFGQQNADNANEFAAAMRRTQYQTAVKDMKLAGLNPILAYGKGGADSFTPAVAPTPDSDIFGDANSAVALKRQSVDIKNVEAQTDATKQQARKTAAEADLARTNANSAKSLGIDPNAGTPALVLRGAAKIKDTIMQRSPRDDMDKSLYERLFNK